MNDPWLAGALDRLGAGKTMKLFNNVSSKAILRSSGKDFFKRVGNFGVQNTKAGFVEAGTEALQEVIQAFGSGTEVTGEQLFDAAGQAFISNLVFGGGGKAIQTSKRELASSYSILSGKLNINQGCTNKSPVCIYLSKTFTGKIWTKILTKYAT